MIHAWLKNEMMVMVFPLPFQDTCRLKNRMICLIEKSRRPLHKPHQDWIILIRKIKFTDDTQLFRKKSINFRKMRRYNNFVMQLVP